MASSTYSRDETIAAITGYYQQFVKMPYLEPSALRLAPEGGWTSINVNELKKRGRTDEAINLLRHLPYLENSGASYGPPIDVGCICIQYHKGSCYDKIIDEVLGLPRHVIPIGGMKDREGHFLLLDTHTGYITTYDIMGNGIEDNEAYDDLPEQDKWKAFPKAPVREFFDRWVRLYEKLIRMVAPTRDPGHTSHGDTGEWFSRDGSVVDEDKLLELDNDEGVIGIDEDDNMLAEYREVTAGVYAIYKRHGWPSQFDREACKSELVAYLEDKDF